MPYFLQKSQRLTFRKLTREDIPVWTQFFYENDRLRFLGIDLFKSHETNAREWIEMQFDRYEERKLGHLAAEITETGEFIGLGGIIPRELKGREEFEIAYSLFPEFWGKGYATELARQMRSFGQKHLQTDRFISIIHKENLPSIKVARKNGMEVLFETEHLGMPVYVYGVKTGK